MPHFDHIIVGAGIAGLNYANNLFRAGHGRSDSSKNKPSVLVLEASEEIGGRTRMTRFKGCLVPTGAGVGRLGKDNALRALVSDMGIPMTDHAPGSVRYHFPNVNRRSSIPRHSATRTPPANVRKLYLYMLRQLDSVPAEGRTFREYATECLQGSKSLYQRFVDSTGYTDFESADAIDTLLHYGFDDTFESTPGHFSFNWNTLAQRLVEGHPTVVLKRARVTHIVEHVARRANTTSPRYAVHVQVVPAVVPAVVQVHLRRPTAETRIYTTQHVVIATPAHVAVDILHADIALHFPLLKYLKSNPFLRVYAKLDADEDSSRFMSAFRGYTVTGRPLHKIIPMDVRRRIYLIAYCDNASAIQLVHFAESKVHMEAIVLAVTGYRIRIRHLCKFFWQHGTHYLSPLSPADHARRSEILTCTRDRGVELIGEAYSSTRGWTNGSLLSSRGRPSQ